MLVSLDAIGAQIRAERSLLPLASTRPLAPWSRQSTISEWPVRRRASRDEVEYTRMREEFVASAMCVSTSFNVEALDCKGK